jgi:hypothetical protein
MDTEEAMPWMDVRAWRAHASILRTSQVQAFKCATWNADARAAKGNNECDDDGLQVR